MKSFYVNGVRVFCPRSRKELIDHAVEEKAILVAVNAEKIMHADQSSRNIINNSIGYPDGFGAVLSIRHKGSEEAIKIPGCELWLDIIHEVSERKSFYLIGATDEVIAKTVAKLREEFPNINILGFRNGYFSSEAEEKNLIDDICLKKPDVVFVALGSPKQEKLMQKLCSYHTCLYQGLGGSFDVYVGKTIRAPEKWVKLNLEWLYRLIKQPSRIKRQIHLIKFLFLLKVVDRY